jgi:hypothetical protein
MPKFRKLATRRAIGRPAYCVCNVDSGRAATAFPGPAESIALAAGLGLFNQARSFLEVGSGNLRNIRYVQNHFAPSDIVAVEQRTVVGRFDKEYTGFRRAGGRVSSTLPSKCFDIIIVTYVLETICPPIDRERLLQDIARRMHTSTRLVLSVRGYPGVRGRHYKRCPDSDGSISFRGAFIRGYSIPDLQSLLGRHGIGFTALKRYRSNTPENIHGIGKVRNG